MNPRSVLIGRRVEVLQQLNATALQQSQRLEGALGWRTSNTSGERAIADAGANVKMDVEEDVEFLRTQARKCRWLADRVNARDVVRTLLQMAREYDEHADRLEAGPEPAPEG